MLRYADLEMDEDAHEVRRAGKLVDLSPTEFNLLRYLLINAGRVVSKAQILDRVWSYDFGGDGRIVESYVYYLRRKIDTVGPAADPHRPRRRLRPAAAPWRRGVTRRPRRWRHWTLRSRLVVVVAALAAVGLVVADTAGVLLLRTYLIDRIDEQLTAMARPFDAQPPGVGTQSPGRQRPADPPPLRRRPRMTYVLRPRTASLDSARQLRRRSRPGRRRSRYADHSTGPRDGRPVHRDGRGRQHRLAADRGRRRAAPAVRAWSRRLPAEVRETTDRLLLIDIAVTLLVLGAARRAGARPWSGSGCGR